jgi:hypothetical protein
MSTTAIHVSGVRGLKRDRFYLGIVLSLWLVVLVGFFPTLFGRAMFKPSPVPGYLILHGAILTGWFVLLTIQASLIAGNNTRLHKKLGWLSLAFLVLMPLAGMGTQLAMPRRLEALGLLEQLKPLVENVFWLNVASTVQFIVFVGLAVLWRKNADSHKRLMLWGSIAIIPPAAARLSRWHIWGNTNTDFGMPASNGLDVGFSLIILGLFILAMIVHDLVKRGRLHKVTLYGAIAEVGLVLIAPQLAGSEWGKSVVWGLM